MKPAYFGEQEIKDVAVKRVREHENLGSVQRGSYGELEIVKPGTAKFRGCAVGCITTPTKYIEIKDGFKNDGEALEAYLAEEHLENPESWFDSDSHGNMKNPYIKIEEQFNFSDELSAMIEAVFECLPDPKDAQGWPRRVIEALPVGVNVEGKHIVDIVRNSDALIDVLHARFSPDYIAENQFLGKLTQLQDDDYRPAILNITTEEADKIYAEAGDFGSPVASQAADDLIEGLENLPHTTIVGPLEA